MVLTPPNEGSCALTIALEIACDARSARVGSWCWVEVPLRPRFVSKVGRQDDDDDVDCDGGRLVLDLE